MIIALHCQTSLHSPLETYFISTADIPTSDRTKFQKMTQLNTTMNVLYVILTTEASCCIVCYVRLHLMCAEDVFGLFSLCKVSLGYMKGTL